MLTALWRSARFGRRAAMRICETAGQCKRHVKSCTTNLFGECRLQPDQTAVRDSRCQPVSEAELAASIRSVNSFEWYQAADHLALHNGRLKTEKEVVGDGAVGRSNPIEFQRQGGVPLLPSGAPSPRSTAPECGSNMIIIAVEMIWLVVGACLGRSEQVSDSSGPVRRQSIHLAPDRFQENLIKQNLRLKLQFLRNVKILLKSLHFKK